MRCRALYRFLASALVFAAWCALTNHCALAEEAARRLPCISILVPLHREPDIAGPLTARLARLDYPRELLDICLVVEADDHATLDALAAADLPRWMRVIPVPDGQPRTKPRAMNYALNFTRGTIVGVYDAEDAPAPDQLMAVATRFQAAPRTVACLQGLLDYYNPTRTGCRAASPSNTPTGSGWSCPASRGWVWWSRWAARRCSSAATRSTGSAAGTRIT